MASCSAHVSARHPPLRCAGAFWRLLSARETFFFFFKLGFLPLGSLPLNQVQRADGHLVRCPGQQGKEPKEQRPALPGTAFSPGELWRGKRSQPRPPPHRGFPATSLFSHQGFLNPGKAESLFPTLEEGPGHCTGWMSISALPYPFCGPQGTGR